MSLHKINPTETKAWKKLIDQKHNLSTETLNSLFSKESNRLNYLSIKWDCFDVDFSKNILNEKKQVHSVLLGWVIYMLALRVVVIVKWAVT